MVLLFTPKISNRIQYVVKFILLEVCGFDYKITKSSEDFLNFKGARINYSDRDFPVENLKVNPSGFLLEKGVKEFSPESQAHNGSHVLFPQKDPGVSCDLGYDIFASGFYMVSRYEEYLPFLEDRFGRFEADQSLAFNHGFIDKPVVDIQAMEFKQKLLEKFPFLTSQERRFRFIPTYDIDIAYAYKGKGLSRNLLLMLKELFTFQLKKLKTRVEVQSQKKADPFDTYPLQLSLQKKYDLRPCYFFLSGEFGPMDRNISVHSKSFFTLVKTLGDYAETGIHPSFASHHKKNRLQQEIAVLEEILKKPVTNSRQHYLKIHLPDTYINLLKNNIKNDFSMAFATHTGFRAGTCTPFHFYNLSEEMETHLRIYPTTLMDGTLKDYMKLSPDQALEKSREMVEQVKKVNGTFVSLWHNHSLADTPEWKEWQRVYVELVKYACETEKR